MAKFARKPVSVTVIILFSCSAAQPVEVPVRYTPEKDRRSSGFSNRIIWLYRQLWKVLGEIRGGIIAQVQTTLCVRWVFSTYRVLGKYRFSPNIPHGKRAELDSFALRAVTERTSALAGGTSCLLKFSSSGCSMCRLISPRWSRWEGSGRSVIRSREAAYPLAVILHSLMNKDMHLWIWSFLVLQCTSAQLKCLWPQRQVLCSLENSRNKNSPFVPQCVTVNTLLWRG